MARTRYYSRLFGGNSGIKQIPTNSMRVERHPGDTCKHVIDKLFVVAKESKSIQPGNAELAIKKINTPRCHFVLSGASPQR
jgi:hypothetical protein